jgi:hypothetical protein
MPPISMCIPPSVARQRLGKHVPAAKNTRKNKIIVGRVIFYAVRVLSKESLWVRLCIPVSLLGNNSVKTFSRQRRIVGGVVFYAVGVESKESRRLILPSLVLQLDCAVNKILNLGLTVNKYTNLFVCWTLK